jgi:hypothetical protein
MHSELKDLLFEIEDSFSRINSRIYFIKNMKNLDQLFDWFEYLKLDCNDLNFYTRALRDKLNESEIL